MPPLHWHAHSPPTPSTGSSTLTHTSTDSRTLPPLTSSFAASPGGAMPHLLSTGIPTPPHAFHRHTYRTPTHPLRFNCQCHRFSTFFYSPTCTSPGGTTASRPVSRPSPPCRGRRSPSVSLTARRTPLPVIGPPAGGAHTFTKSACLFSPCPRRFFTRALPTTLASSFPSSSPLPCRSSRTYPCWA